jgi:HAD superfamily hydrolase (TIGR01509 family)
MSQPIYEWLRERHDFFELFDAVVVSGAVRLVKPEPGIYQYLAKAYGLVPQQSLFIDDMRANIDAALNCGFQEIHFTDAPALRRQLEAHGIEID